MITIINYGLGNVGAFLNMYKRMNIAATIATRPEDLSDADRIVLPGVGAFDHAMQLLNASGMREPLDELVQARGVPVIGVCVGMQILAHASDEGQSPGLGWVPGRVRSLASRNAARTHPLPHMGWNDVRPGIGDGLFAGLSEDARFYFLHSFYFECEDEADSLATVEYGSQFSCAVQRENVYGVQFHPEKSHHYGAALLKNFAAI